jgi:uncharacterized protein YjeT (DUF2065 family)
MKRIQTYFQKNPRLFGIVLVVIGIIVLLAAIKNAKWLFETNRSTYALNKMDGWINIFGAKAGKIAAYIVSVLLILSGIIYFVLWK